jgi:transposase-like protein
MYILNYQNSTIMNFKSLHELLDTFKDEKTCIAYYEQLRWNGKPVCPHCNSENPYKTNRGYKCSNKDCYKKFTVKVGTIFENSKIPFRVWFGAIFLATNHKKGISSLQLPSDLNITQKTAWFVLHRVREMLKSNAPTMLGGEKTIEADETYIGGKLKNKHANKIKRDDLGKAIENKQLVLGLIERNVKVVLKHIKSASINNMVPFVEKTVQVGS